MDTLSFFLCRETREIRVSVLICHPVLDSNQEVDKDDSDGRLKVLGPVVWRSEVGEFQTWIVHRWP